MTSNSAQLGGKRLEFLKAVAPKASRVALLYNPGDNSNVLASKGLAQSAPALGLTLQRVEVRKGSKPSDLPIERSKSSSNFVPSQTRYSIT